MVITCDATDQHSHLVTHPHIIMEIFSPSTEQYDSGFKLHQYLVLPIVPQVLLIGQDQPYVEAYLKRSLVLTEIHRFDQLDQTIPLTDLPLELSLAHIYRDLA